MTISYVRGEQRLEELVPESREGASGASHAERHADVRFIRPLRRHAERVDSPRDWPGPGPIDLGVHDLPHASSTTEWWYVNAHLTTEEGRHFTLFVAFFRQAKARDPRTKEWLYAHSVTWAISSLDDGKYFHYSGIDQSAPEEGLKRLKRGLGAKDPKLNRALAEVLEKGKVPSPDRVFDGRVFVNLERLELEYAGDGFKKLDDGSYQLRLGSEKLGAGCSFTLSPKKPPIRHGDDGVVKGS